jgi:UDP-2,3-diacylglucosamine hydrolase
MAPKLGIVAGSGELPMRVLDAARAAGRFVFVLALEGAADPALVAGSVPHGWIRLGAAAKGIALLRDNGIEEIVFAGGVRRPSLLSLMPDWRAAKFLAKIGTRALGDNGLLGAIVRTLEEEEGFRVVGADTILASSLVPSGPLGRISPDPVAENDIALGMKAARALGALDIGQAVIVQQGVVLAVEAAEGTDALLARSKDLGREGPGGILVKLVKPGQERRVDLPTIGPGTVRNAAAAGLRGIAVEANAALILDRAATIEAADRAGLFVVGIAGG